MDDMSFRSQLIGDALKKMFSDRHVSSCLFREATKLAKVHPPADLVSWFSIHHCDDWSEFTGDMKREILARTLTAFVHDRVPVEAIDDCLGMSGTDRISRPLLTTSETHPDSPLASMAKEIIDPITQEVERQAKDLVRSVDERVEKIIEARLAEHRKPSFFRRLLGGV